MFENFAWYDYLGFGVIGLVILIYLIATIATFFVVSYSWKYLKEMLTTAFIAVGLSLLNENVWEEISTRNSFDGWILLSIIAFILMLPFLNIRNTKF